MIHGDGMGVTAGPQECSKKTAGISILPVAEIKMRVRLEKISLLTDDEGRESRENHQMSSLIVGEKPNIQFCV